MMSESASIPLCVDMDGTLAKQDLLLVGFINLLKQKFLTGLRLSCMLPIKGKAAFKKAIADNATIDLKKILFNQELIEFLLEERAQGRNIMLVSGNDQRIAQKVADHLGFFSEVMASDGKTNLTGKNKANKLTSRYGAHGFDYVGNEYSDVEVWKQARKVYMVAGNPRVLAKVNSQIKIDRVFNW